MEPECNPVKGSRKISRRTSSKSPTQPDPMSSWWTADRCPKQSIHFLSRLHPLKGPAHGSTTSRTSFFLLQRARIKQLSHGATRVPSTPEKFIKCSTNCQTARYDFARPSLNDANSVGALQVSKKERTPVPTHGLACVEISPGTRLDGLSLDLPKKHFYNCGFLGSLIRWSWVLVNWCYLVRLLHPWKDG